jgi:hypothetical protein
MTTARLQHVRDLFAMTADQEAQVAKDRQSEIEAQLKSAEDEAFKTNPPLDSVTQLQQISLIRNEQELAKRRLQSERNMLLNQLASENALLDEQKQALDRQRADWENAVRADRERKVDEQFLQAVRQLEQVTPKQAKQMIAQMISDNQMDLAVAYLDSMAPRAASKILREFKSETEIALATQLLEKLRTFGRQAPLPGAEAADTEPEPANADGDARADAGNS